MSNVMSLKFYKCFANASTLLAPLIYCPVHLFASTM